MSTAIDTKNKQALKAYSIIDTPPEKEYDQITRLAAHVCNTPISLISFQDGARHFFKSYYGLDYNQIQTAFSFSAYAIKEPNQPFIVEDAREDERFNNNPFVVSPPHFVFYAGVSIVSPEGIPLGALNVMDYKARTLSEDQVCSLKSLAHQVVQLLELRKTQFETKRHLSTIEDKTNRLKGIIEATRVGTWEWNVQTGEVIYNNRWAEIVGYTLEELQPLSIEIWNRLMHPDDIEFSDKKIQECFDKKATDYDIEFRMFHKEGHIVWINDRGRVVSWTEDGEPLLVMGTHTDITERKTTEIQLQTIADNIPGLVFRYTRSPDHWDELGLVSKGALDVWGMTADEAMRDNSLVWKRIDPKDIEGLRQSIQNSADKLSYWTYRWRYHHPDGSLRWHKGSGNPTRLKDGSIVWDCIILDITEKKQIEEQLLLREQRFKALVQEGSDLIGILDAEGNYIYVSPTSENILGISPEEFLGKNAFDFIHPEDVEAVMLNFSMLTSEKSVTTSPFRFKNNKGEWRWIETVLTDLTNDPAVQGIVSNSRDVTEREKTFQALKESEARYRGFYESQTNYVIRTDLQGHYTYANKKFKEDFGWLYPENEVLGQDAMKSILEYHHQKTVETMEKCLKNPGVVYKIEIDKPTRDGGYISSLWDSVCIADEQGTPMEIQCVGIDITERIKFEKELIKSNERNTLINKATNDAIYDWDMKKDTITWGEGFYRNFGYAPEKEPFSVSDWNRLVHPSDSEKYDKNWERFKKDERQNRWSYEFRFLRANGKYAYVKEISFLMRDDTGNPERMIGVLRDHTQSKLQEIQQQVESEVANRFKKEDKLSKILDNVLSYLAKYADFMTAEIWLTGTDLKHLNLAATYKKNKSAQLFFNETKEINKLKPGKGLPGIVFKNKKVEVWNTDIIKQSFIRKSAAQKAGIQSVMGIPLFHNQNTVGVLVFGSRKTVEMDEETILFFKPLEHFLGAEIMRKQQQEELHLFFKNAPEILGIASPDGYFTKVNPAFCELLGYTEYELTSQPFTNFIHPDDLNTTKKEYDETITGKRQSDNFINRYRTVNGEYKWISWSSSGVFGEEGFVFVYGRNITEMIELQQLFQKAAKLARIGSWELDLRQQKNENSLFWSEMTREIFEVENQYNPSLSGGMEFYVGEHKKMLTGAVQRLIASGEPFKLELLILTGKGNLRWVRCIGESEIIDGKCRKVFGSYQDIHQRKAAEIKLKEALNERNTILESIGDAFFAVNQDWIVTYWNKEAENLLSTRKEDIVGKALWDVFKNYVGLESYRAYHKAMETGETMHFEDHYPDADKWFEISAYPSVKGLSVYFKDVSIRKQAEEHIRLSNERFEKITEATNDAIWDFDVIEDKLFWGKGFFTLFGYAPDKKAPSFDYFTSLIHPEDREHVVQKIQEYMTDGTSTHWFEEYRFLKADGTYALVIDRAVFIRNEQGMVKRVVGAITDISYRKEYEESLKNLNVKLEKHAKDLEISNAELEQFAYVASHDLQEPLRMVSSFLTQLERKYGGQLDEKAHQYIFYAVDGAKRMRQIILDLLEYSRVGRLEEEKERVDIHEVVNDFCILRQKMIAEKKAKIITGSLPVLTHYKTPITQIFNNLLDNALKYGKEDVAPKVEIKTKDKGTYWEFTVKDNGIGIDKAYFDKIFVIFQRLHDKDTYSGTGMGLAIVKKIIDNLGGKIWVNSQTGKGSSFHFTLNK